MKKKRIVILTGVIFFCVVGFGIYIWGLLGNEKEESPFTLVNQWDFVYMDEKELTEEGFNVGTYVDSDKKIYSKLFYYLEEKGENGKWYTIPFKEGIDEKKEMNLAKAFFMPYGYENPYGDKDILFGTISIRYLEYYDPLLKGEYRAVVPICYTQNLKEVIDYRTIEFTVEQDMDGYDE